jgi:hypothetical protein
MADSSRGLGYRPLKAETRVRIPYPLPSQTKPILAEGWALLLLANRHNLRYNLLNAREWGDSVSDKLFSPTDIQKALETAADVIATTPPEQWAGWVRYFLEELEALADIQKYRIVLGDVREDVTIRLERGRW